MGKTIKVWATGMSIYHSDNDYNIAKNAEVGEGNTDGFGQFYYAPRDEDYSIYRGAHLLDTIAIPIGAIVIAATFNFYLNINDSGTDFDLVIQKLITDTPTPDLTWYNKDNFSDNGGSLNTSGLTGYGQLVSVPFNETGLSWILKGEKTKMGVRSSRDIAGIQPSGLEYITYYSSAYYNITYTAVPEVTTVKSAYVTETTAYGYGKINNSNDDAHCDKKGICYNKTGDPTVEDNKVEVEGTFGSGHSFSLQLTGLDPGTKYYFKAYGHNLTGYGYGAELEFTTLVPPITAANVKAELNRVFARVLLYGELTNGEFAVERGFEYLIQDVEPGAGDLGIEVKETNDDGFETGEYKLRNKILYDQQYIADNIVWWFRAYCKDVTGTKSVASSWMKNLPNILTQDMTNINYNKADGNGIIISKGASDLTERGFEVKHEYSGSFRDSWKFEIAGFEGELEEIAEYDSDGIFIIGYHREGTLIKTVIETFGLAVGAYLITVGEMIWGWPVMDNCLIEGKAYKCRAFASNEFGTVYGDEVDFTTWARTYLSEDSPTTGEISIIKNEIIENLPFGITATRRGFRYGTTEAADEFDVHENGSFTNGPYSMMLTDLLPDTTYYIYAYIVVDGIIYEGDLETITTDPEGTEDEDEYPTPHYSPHGQDYREMETKVFAEVLASQGIIDFSGGKKTLPISNHLIQTNSNAKIIADNYLDRFKLAKTRMSVSFPTPLPFEREDTVDFSYGALLFKEDDEGVVHFKEDGEGASVLMDQISMIIKKINSVGLTKTPESIEYVAVLDLEHG